MSDATSRWRRRFRRTLITLWLATFVAISFLIVHAGRHWKVPTRGARQYWESRLAGLPQGFLGSDERWHYFGLKGFYLHGWVLGRVSHEAAARVRTAAVREHIAGVLAEPGKHAVAELRALTGLSLSTIDEWQAWWREHEQSYVWPSEQEERWATAICAEFERSNERNVDRVACIADITSIPRKMVIEITLLAALLFVVWPLGPALVRACRQIIGHRRPVRGTVFGACLVAALFYVVAVFPYAWFHYAPGASTTYAGPGYLIFSGPYPFHLQYKPGNTIIYRQFVELLFDPTIRMVNAGWLTWMPAVPVYVVALVPYLVAAAVVGCGTALLGRRRRMSAPAAEVLSGLPEYYDVDPQRI